MQDVFKAFLLKAMFYIKSDDNSKHKFEVLHVYHTFSRSFPVNICRVPYLHRYAIRPHYPAFKPSEIGYKQEMVNECAEGRIRATA